MTSINKDQIKAVIFDMDGTLLDSMHIYVAAINSVLEQFNTSCTAADIEPLSGLPPKEIYKYFLEKIGTYNKSKEDELKLQFNKKFAELMKDTDGFPKDSIDCLKQIKAKGYRIALGTGALKHLVLMMIPKDIMSLFDAVITSEDVSRYKPDPETFLKASEKLKVRPENCIVIGDGNSDFLAAKEGNMKFIFIRNSHNKNFAHSGQCDNIIGNILELTHIL